MIEKRFRESVLKNSLCRKSDRILVAVSGGKDSMALLNLFYENGYTIEVAHFNFKLREEDSDLDENLVKSYCKKRNIPLHIGTANTKAFAQQNKLSTQMAARDLRYNWFKKLLAEHELDCIATAHHLNDNLETLLLNITKGTGPIGLMGIPVKTHQIIRPLLDITSEEITSYLKEKNIEWREDLSNQKDDYARNRIRNQVIPQLKIINPGLEQTVNVNLSRFKDLSEIFREKLSDFSNKIIEEGKTRKIPLELLTNTTGIALFLEEYLKDFGFNHQDVNALLTISHSGKRIVSASHELTLDRNFWLLEESHESFEEMLVLKEEGEYNFGEHVFILKITTDKPDIQELKTPNYAFLDLDKVIWPLQIRIWREQDKFKPFGMNGKSKLVSDYLMDIKQDRAEKRNQLVLEDQNKILWLVGQRTSHEIKLTDYTQKFLVIKFEKRF
jgi:tRNA(Ile)-lysidine synthase